MTTMGSPDVMRFLGRKLILEQDVPSRFAGEVVSDIKTRPEGVRIKHRMNHNSVKAYDKAYTQETAVLRVETTLNDEADFKVFRPKEGEPDGEKAWRTLRRGVADMHRRAEVSHAANGRYLDALSSVDDSMTLEELIDVASAPVEWNSRRVRGLHPFEGEDVKLLEAVSRGEFTLNGLRNRDLQRLLYPTAPTYTVLPAEARRRSARITRKLRMLRAHGILQKVAHTHRYQLTETGRKLITAVLTARQTPISQLLPKTA
jgi:hypothetical protein